MEVALLVAIFWISGFVVGEHVGRRIGWRRRGEYEATAREDA